MSWRRKRTERAGVWHSGKPAQTLGCPRMNKGWYKQCGQGVGTQIVGGPKIRVGWVERSFYGIGRRGREVYERIQLGYRIGLDGV